MAQAPSNEQLYQMILELQRSQKQLKEQLKAAQAETLHVKKKMAALEGALVAQSQDIQLSSTQRRLNLAFSPQSDTRAVAAPNGSIGFGGGSNGKNAFGFTEGSFALPLGEKYGFQVDAVGGLSRSNPIGGGAVHLFRRDPQIGAIGVYGSYLHSGGGYDDGRGGIQNGYGEAKLGFEGQYYLDRVTLEGLAGIEWNSLDKSFGPFAEGRVNYYPTDNFKINAGLRYRDAFGGRLQAVGGAEYLTELGSSGTAISLSIAT